MARRTSTAGAKANKVQGDFARNTLALIYDFDGTLTPQPMQEYTVLPQLGIAPQDFWAEVNAEAKRTGGDGILTYMRLLVEKIEANKAHLSRDALRKLARDVQYFPGVETWFERVNRYVASASGGTVQARHYIISAGLSEILEGISIKHHFERIYASQYHFNHHEVACFPTIVINDTSKTQYLFRINKGVHNNWEHERINRYKPDEDRPVPFERMIFIGDGDTDVPTMKMMHTKGGYSIAVYDPRNSERDQQKIYGLISEDRVNFVAAADYREGSALDLIVKGLIGRIAITAGTVPDVL